MLTTAGFAMAVVLLAPAKWTESSLRRTTRLQLCREVRCCASPEAEAPLETSVHVSEWIDSFRGADKAVMIVIEDAVTGTRFGSVGLELLPMTADGRRSIPNAEMTEQGQTGAGEGGQTGEGECVLLSLYI